MPKDIKKMRKKWFIYRYIRPAVEKESTLFRKCFLYDGKTDVIVNITADSRYILFINGQYLRRGPASGDLYRKYYDELDITKYLREGKNCIGVQVIHYAPGDDGIQRFSFGPTALSGSCYGGLCVYCKDDAVDINTNTSWKFWEDTAYEFKESVMAKYAGDVERIDFRKRPSGWTNPDFDDTGWKSCAAVQEADEKEPSLEYGIMRNWMLCKRDIPLLEERRIYPAAIHSKTEGVPFVGLLDGLPVIIQPYTEATCEIDMGQLVTAYVKSDYGAGGGTADYLYSECYYMQKNGSLYKENRGDWKNGVLTGETDELILAGTPFVYEPFEYRAFRVLKLTIRTEAQPVVLNGITFRQTNYPLSVKASFEAENPKLARIWRVSIHTLKCCMQDIYMDCPYYERLQYVMDAMIEALNTYPLSGDDRLARKALLDFAGTQMPDGMIHCDAPSNDRHVIPGYAIYFIDMLYQHYWYFNDRNLIKKYWAVCAGLLQYFEERTDEQTGLIKNCGYWEFVDWTGEWNDTKGVPGGKANDSPHYIYSMMYAYGLLRMSELTEAVYGTDAAKRWKTRYCELKNSVNKTVFHKGKGYYRTTASEEQFSQHAQIWAVMSGCAADAGARDLMIRTAGDPSLIRCSYPMQYYYNRALEKAGAGCREQPIWKEYGELLEKGVTTWPEDPVTARSDCHGWSAVPIYEICHGLLGVKPGTPGFGSIIIEPGQLELGSLSGEVWTPRGMVRVERLVKNCGNGIELSVTAALPQKMKAVLRLAGRDVISDFCDSMKYKAVIDRN